MAKAPADTIKYNIYAEIIIDGVVEKPDVVGAVFGQSEGLLGEDLELRDLQKTGRIGRIEVDIKTKVGKSTGKIIVPSSLDMVETSIIASAIEQVDRVGPCNAKITVSQIEDARSTKRTAMIERAKGLLKKLMDEEIPETDVLTDEVKKAVQLSEITSYKGLPAGPAVKTSDSVILVEGRADVLNLLKAGIKNAVAVGGTNVPQQIVDLSKAKMSIIFADGDRGGDIISKELCQIADIDFVTKAPEGKEVEELSKKEIIMALRRKTPPKQRGANSGKIHDHAEKEPAPQISSNPLVKEEPSAEKIQETVEEGKSEEIKKLLEELNAVKGKLNARLFDKNMNMITEIEIKDLVNSLADVQPQYVVFDGIVTQRLVDAAAKSKVSSIVGVSKSNITSDHNLKILTEKA
ncbi:DNA primase DnaG [Candidatus Altiarchaeota archaeon]